MKLNKQLWNQRYLDSNTGWDVGYITTPIKEYIDQIQNKEIKILVPGSGNGYEAEYLYKLGFKNIFVLDYANQALENFKNRLKIKLINLSDGVLSYTQKEKERFLNFGVNKKIISLNNTGCKPSTPILIAPGSGFESVVIIFK